MNMQPVTSSNVAAVGYDADTLTLAVEFLNGSTYHYSNVSEATFNDLLNAESVGKYLNMMIKPYRAYTQVS